MWGVINWRTREKPKINFRQITEKIGVLVIFRFSFGLNWTLETPKYTSLVVFFFRKAQNHGFSVWIFAYLGFICSVNGIFGISGDLRRTNMTKTDQNNLGNIILKHYYHVPALLKGSNLQIQILKSLKMPNIIETGPKNVAVADYSKLLELRLFCDC